MELLKDNGFNVHLNDDRSVNIVGVGTLKISGATVTLEAKHPFSVIRIYRDVPAVQEPKRLGEENPHPWAHAIVMHPEVRERIDAAPDFHSVSVYPYGCVLVYVGIDTEESRNAILWFIEFYRLLLERLYAPLIDAASSHGLDVRPFPNNTGFQMTGRVEPIAIVVHYMEINSSLRLRLSWPLDQVRVPFRLAHREHRKPSAGAVASTGNPMLDRLLVLQCDGPTEAVSAFLNTPGVAEQVLSIVHQYPGSTMTEKGLTMKIRDVWPHEVAEKIDGGVAAAQAIIAAGRLYLDCDG